MAEVLISAIVGIVGVVIAQILARQWPSGSPNVTVHYLHPAINFIPEARTAHRSMMHGTEVHPSPATLPTTYRPPGESKPPPSERTTDDDAAAVVAALKVAERKGDKIDVYLGQPSKR